MVGHKEGDEIGHERAQGEWQGTPCAPPNILRDPQDAGIQGVGPAAMRKRVSL